ncbi:MAG TPA: histidine phosphatase family protein, partial [Microbacterium sp.]|nr:histidine phosphatase family protein [Microbacterium sp.]
EPLRHDPRDRRCSLSSVTSFERGASGWVEVEYAEPVATTGAVDVGAV